MNDTQHGGLYKSCYLRKKLYLSFALTTYSTWMKWLFLGETVHCWVEWVGRMQHQWEIECGSRGSMKGGSWAECRKNRARLCQATNVLGEGREAVKGWTNKKVKNISSQGCRCPSWLLNLRAISSCLLNLKEQENWSWLTWGRMDLDHLSSNIHYYW